MSTPDEREALKQERWHLLETLSSMLDKPMVALSLVWLILVIIELAWGLNPILMQVTNLIWALFILDFALEFLIAPHKPDFLRREWLVALSIILPAFRILRVLRAFPALRAARAVRSVNLLRILASVRRGTMVVRETLGRYGFGYVVGITLLMLFAGAAGMAYFETPVAVSKAGYPGSSGLKGYADALWFTAMLLTTIGSDYWPKTPEGRVLTYVLAVYAFGISGYITATIASYLIQHVGKSLNP